LFGTLVAIGVGQALAAITIGLLVQRGFDTLVTGTAPITASAALPIGGGLAVAVLLAATLRGVERFAAERLGQHYVLEVRETLFKHLTRVRHRVVGPEHAGLLLWTLSYRNSWSMIFHSDNNLVLHTAVLGLSPSADSLSVDAVLAHGRLDPQLRDWRYGLPSRLINAVTTATYFVAGVAKLKGPLGWSWATGESLRSQIAADGLRKELLGSSAAPLGLRLYGQTGLFRLLAVGSLVIELAAPLALLDRRLGRAWAVGAFGLHWGILALMGIKFRHQLSGVIFASFFPVDRLPARGSSA